MAVQQSELTPVELESFADESKRICLFHVMKGDIMMPEKVKLQTAEQPRLWTYFSGENFPFLACNLLLPLQTMLNHHRN